MRDFINLIRAIGVVLGVIIVFYVAIIATYVIAVIGIIYIVYKLLQANAEETSNAT